MKKSVLNLPEIEKENETAGSSERAEKNGGKPD